MFVRFVVPWIDPDSGERTGLFAAMHRLKTERALSVAQEAHWDEVRAWFEGNLRAPDRLARSAYPRAKNTAISWFKDTATEHVRRMHEVAEMLRAHDIPVEIIRTSRPGYVLYEDEFQVAAEPFNDSRA